MTDLKNRGVADVFFVVCDGLKGLPDVVGAVFPAAVVQACVIHLTPGHPACEEPLSTTQNTRRALAYGSLVITCSTS